MKKALKFSIVILVIIALFIGSFKIYEMYIDHLKSGGPPPAPHELIGYRVSLDKTEFEFGEEITLNVRLSHSIYSTFIGDGGLYFKLEQSDAYEIIGSDVAFISDFNSDDYTAFNGNSPKRYAEASFKIKVTASSFLPEAILFKAKFNRTKEYDPNKEYGFTPNYCPEEEYFYHFHEIFFVSDSQGVIFAEDCYYRWGGAPGYDFFEIEKGKTGKVMEMSLNREHAAGVSETELLKRLAVYSNRGKTAVGIYPESDFYVYISNGITAKFVFDDDVISQLFSGDGAGENARTVLSYLLSEGDITDTEYASELLRLEEFGAAAPQELESEMSLNFEAQINDGFFDIIIDKTM